MGASTGERIANLLERDRSSEPTRTACMRRDDARHRNDPFGGTEPTGR